MPEKTIITPTIGRRVWYYPSAYDRGELEHKPPSVIRADTTQPCDAGICYVHGDRLVNLTVADHNGRMHARTSVTLLQKGDPTPPAGMAYATWMPYQLGQAKAADAALESASVAAPTT